MRWSEQLQKYSTTDNILYTLRKDAFPKITISLAKVILETLFEELLKYRNARDPLTQAFLINSENIDIQRLNNKRDIGSP